MSAARDTYSILRTDNPLRISIPEYNYRSGKQKSALFQGPGWYIPSEIRWESYNEHHELPRLTRRDAVEMQCEEDFINFLNKRYVPNNTKITAHVPSAPPRPKWNGHTRVMTTEFDNTCYYNTTRMPIWDGPGYYGYYQEILDRMRKGQCRRRARQGMIGYPFFTHQTYF
ncbi:hypothetical protein CSKR_105779 [Clonorchis sinensis]|uniref:Uncharacterized protein n=1 Tax=Clonorchis sinensis TaxID=79923 RepID=A0A8T1MXC0_CLOSI|nr:hypothetical protein CSKR_105779 [Clonorchis sinensis]